MDGRKISGIETAHVSLTIKVGPVKKTERPGINQRIGWGSMGFKISYKGKSVVNLGAISMIRPEVVIPVHYNCPMLFSKNGNPADETYFQRESEKLGIDCVILKKGCSFQMN